VAHSGSLLEQSLFGEAIENCRIGAFLEREQRVIAVNQAVSELTGYSHDEIVSGRVPPLAAEEDTQRQRDEVRAGRRSEGKGRIRRKDGSIIGVSYLVARTRVARDTLLLGFLWADS
jgi:PAS domain S-box-containing protein